MFLSHFRRRSPFWLTGRLIDRSKEIADGNHLFDEALNDSRTRNRNW